MQTLEDLLDRAAEALVAGDITALAALAPRIEESAARMVPVDRASAGRLHQKSERNARLLEAASRGVMAARRRVTEITQGPTLTTYDARGIKAAIAPSGLEAARRV
jgi:hypothetical protein